MVQRKQRQVKKQNTIKNEYIYYILGGLCFIFFIYLFSDSSDPEQSQILEKLVKKNEIKAPTAIVKPVKKNIRLPQIEIQNGCGIEGVASRFKSLIREQDIDVIATGNYSDFKQKNSFILLHDINYKTTAENLAKKLGLTVKDIKNDIKPTPLNELTLVLGMDYGKLISKESNSNNE